MLRLPRQAPTVGLLVCGSRNEHTVRYALTRTARTAKAPSLNEV
ncbi:hypothetical protein [Arthrobacter bambusae]|nr:hypothetical protein [Arthrobacter bambusae]